MNIVCLDMEGVLIPKIRIAFAEATGIPTECLYIGDMQFDINVAKNTGVKSVSCPDDVIEKSADLLDGLKNTTV